MYWSPLAHDQLSYWLLFWKECNIPLHVDSRVLTLRGQLSWPHFLHTTRLTAKARFLKHITSQKENIQVLETTSMLSLEIHLDGRDTSSKGSSWSAA